MSLTGTAFHSTELMKGTHFMGTNNVVFLRSSGEIKWGAQLIVRESQAAVFFYNGKAYDAVGAGRHTLKTANIPILTKALSMPWGMTSPLRAEVYFINMKVFPNLKWGTRDPVAFRDAELGLIRLRAFGVFILINSLVGTQGVFTTDAIEEYLNRVIVSRFNDYMGEHIDTIFNLPARYNQLSEGLKKVLEEDFTHFGLGLNQLYINSITPPPEVQKAIDDKSRLGVFDDLNRLLRMKAAMAIETASQSQGESGAGLGMGMGFMMPAMFAEAFKGIPSAPQETPEIFHCPDCRQAIPRESRFCPHCGHQILVFQQCLHCGKNLPASANFCVQCGHPVEQKAPSLKCSRCGTENLSKSVFCNYCGERIE